jgi:translation initiation factor 1 (eIF-1/SUI1)
MPPMKPEDPTRRDRPLTHNPFAALRGTVPEAPKPSDAPAERPPAPAPLPPPRREVRARVTVRRERSGRGGKTVTLAEGPGLAGRDLASLAREAAGALGLGARVESGALVLQGDQRERLARWLAGLGFAQVVRGN